jgi:hypothetical protein
MGWIAKAHLKKGAFTRQAKAAGKSVAQFAKEKAGAGGVTGRRARLALTLRKMSKSKGK